ncbi:hypothetical protein P8935_07730 [Telmatobacter sp. DSM 110680]|uniref:Uncharacterized protein n=1 Tax=Telmatobacter sp. DSM 110680 TaxID=3036704 RepID=A0AAU7DNG5_9BACT
MSFSTQNDGDRSARVVDAEQTLRLIAMLPAPEGVGDRVKDRLRVAPRKSGVISWPISTTGARWTQFAPMRAAAAAAIVLVVAGGAWEVYAHIRIAPEPSAEATPQLVNGSRGGLSTAGAVRKPQTMDGLVVAVPASGERKSDPEILTTRSLGAKASDTRNKSVRLTPR